MQSTYLYCLFTHIAGLKWCINICILYYLLIFVAACVLVENEVFIRRTEYARLKLPVRLPKEADHSYGYSFVLSWISFVFFLGAGLVFLFTSHKKKADNLTDPMDNLEIDEPIAIRRWDISGLFHFRLYIVKNSLMFYKKDGKWN